MKRFIKFFSVFIILLVNIFGVNAYSSSAIEKSMGKFYAKLDSKILNVDSRIERLKKINLKIDNIFKLKLKGDKLTKQFKELLLLIKISILNRIKYYENKHIIVFKKIVEKKYLKVSGIYEDYHNEKKRNSGFTKVAKITLDTNIKDDILVKNFGIGFDMKYFNPGKLGDPSTRACPAPDFNGKEIMEVRLIGASGKIYGVMKKKDNKNYYLNGFSISSEKELFIEIKTDNPTTLTILFGTNLYEFSVEDSNIIFSLFKDKTGDYKERIGATKINTNNNFICY